MTVEKKEKKKYFPTLKYTKAHLRNSVGRRHMMGQIVQSHHGGSTSAFNYFLRDKGGPSYWQS